MTEQRFELDIRDALLAGPQRAPVPVVDAALAQVQVTRQRRPLVRALDGRAWPPSAIPAGDRRMRLAVQVVLVVALVAAGASAVAVVGSRLLDATVPLPVRETSVVPAGTLRIAVNQPTAIALDDGRILVAGGAVDGSLGAVFDPATGRDLQLSTGLSMDLTKAVRLPDGRVFLLAMQNGQPVKASRSLAFVFDPRTNRLSRPVETLQQRFESAIAVLADGHVLVEGGIVNPEDPTVVTRSEVFDPDALAFTLGPDVAAAGHEDQALGLPSGDVLLVHAADTRGSAVDLLDPRTGAVRRVDPADKRAISLGSRERQLVPLADGRVLLIGSQTWPKCGIHGIEAVPAWLFDPSTSALTRVADAPHSVSAATALPDGRIVLAGQWAAIKGGCGSGNDYTEDHWFAAWDPATGRTEQTRNPLTGEGTLLDERDIAYAAAARLPDGRVALVEEGRDGANAIDLLSVGP